MECKHKFNNIDISLSHDINQVPLSQDESNLIVEIKNISERISSRHLLPIENLEVYSDIIDNLEKRKEKYENRSILNLTPLKKFAESSEKLTEIIENFIKRCESLGTINTFKAMTKIRDYMIKIDKFSKVSNNFRDMMKNPSRYEWYKKYNKSIQDVNDTLLVSVDATKNLVQEYDVFDTSIFEDYPEFSKMLDEDNLKKMDDLKDYIEKFSEIGRAHV